MRSRKQRQAIRPPIVLFFRLRDSPLPDAGCWCVRDEQELPARHLDALPDEEPAAEIHEAMMAAVSAFGEERWEELYDDDELARAKRHRLLVGYNFVVAPARLRQALEKDGYDVLDAAERAPFAELPFSEVTRHLRLASRASVLASIRAGSACAYHAGQVSTSILATLEAGDARVGALVRSVKRAGWTGAERALFALIAAKDGVYRATKQTASPADARRLVERLRTVLSALEPFDDDDVRRQLARWKLVGAAVNAFELPKTLPRSTADALELIERVTAAGVSLPLGAPAKRVPTLPRALAELYARHDHVGARAVVVPKEIAGLRARLRRLLREAADVDADDLDEDAIPVAALSPIARLVPFGVSPGGDIFFIDPRFDRGKPILRCVHDEGPMCRVEASSLGAYLAAFALGELEEQGRVGGRAIDIAALRALVAADRKRASVAQGR